MLQKCIAQKLKRRTINSLWSSSIWRYKSGLILAWAHPAITWTNAASLSVRSSLWQWFHDDVIKWKHFLRYWPFVRGIHRSPVNSSHKDQSRGALMFYLFLRLNKRLSKQWWDWWFETPSRSLWRHFNGIILNLTANILATSFDDGYGPEFHQQE